MLFSNSKKRVDKIYREYPRQFWIIVGSNFIDRVGGGMIFPFFALYITKQFQVGMTEVGLLFALFSISDMFGNMIGGALTDFLGRKSMIIMGLIISALTSLAMGMVQQLEWFFVMGAVSGLFATAAGPAHQAMLTDILSEKKRAEGFGVMRVAANLAVAIGPAIGGFIESDFVASKTDSRGHRVVFKYQIAKPLQTAVTYYHAEDASSSTGDLDYRRLLADLVFKF